MKLKLWVIVLFAVVISSCNSNNGGVVDQVDQPQLTSTPTEQLEEDKTETTQDEVPPEPSTAADIVFHNGVVLTMNPSQPQEQAIAIKGGEILFVGSEADVSELVGSGTSVIDLQGKTIMPGFIDSHSHVFYHVLNNTDNPEHGLLEFQDWLLSQGITSIAEAGVDADLLEWMVAADISGDLRVRTSLYPWYTNSCGDELGHWYSDHPYAHYESDFLRIPGVKICSDGGACNTPAVSFDYVGGGNGDLYFSAENLGQIIIDIQNQGYQVVLHALGDRAAEMALNALETASGGDSNPYRHRIDHNTLLRDELLPRYGETGVVPVIFGKFPTCFFIGDTSQFRFVTPLEFRHWEWRYGDLITANPNLNYAWHADWPVFSSINPIEHLYGFVTRQEMDGAGNICAPPDWAADDRISPEVALRFMTANAAYAIQFEDITGSLEVGKYADLIILSDNPLEIPPDDLIELEVLMTMVGGNVEHCAAGQEAFCPSTIEAISLTPTEAEVEPVSGENIALGALVTASGNLPDTPAAYVVDGDLDAVWISGADAPQWVEIDLGAPQTVSAIRLQVAQSPSGNTEHQIFMGTHDGNFELVHTFIGFTEERQWLVHGLQDSLSNIQYVRIETVSSPSWVAWYEIEVYGE
jgi:predicted amidohydrolase YtcJ